MKLEHIWLWLWLWKHHLALPFCLALRPLPSRGPTGTRGKHAKESFCCLTLRSSARFPPLAVFADASTLAHSAARAASVVDADAPALALDADADMSTVDAEYHVPTLKVTSIVTSVTKCLGGGVCIKP